VSESDVEELGHIRCADGNTDVDVDEQDALHKFDSPGRPQPMLEDFVTSISHISNETIALTPISTESTTTAPTPCRRSKVTLHKFPQTK
jgi:hypothetical protein